MRKIILWAFSILIFILPFVFSYATEQIFEINKFALLLVFAGLISVLSAFNKTAKIKLSKQQKLILYFFAIFCSTLLFSTIYSISPWISFWGSHTYHQGLLLFIAVFTLTFCAISLQINKQELWQYFLLPLIITGSLEGAIAIWQYFNPNFLFADLALNTYQGRSVGTFGQPNFLARFLLFPFFASLYYFWEKKNFYYLIPLLLTLAGILASQSRAGLLAILLGIFVFILVRTKNWKQILLMIIGLALGAGIAFFVFADQFTNRIESAETRLYIWRNTEEIVQSTPFWGSGLESQEGVLAKINDQELFDLVDWRTLDRAHNEILDFIIQIGLLGTIFYVLFLGATLWGKQKNPLFIIITTSFFARMFEFFSITELFLFFLFLSILAFSNNSQKTKKSYSLALSTFLFCASIAFFYTAQNVWQADRLYFQGKISEAYELQQYNKKYVRNLAQSGDITVLDNLPEWAESYYLKAQNNLASKNKETALQNINQALELFPSNRKYQKLKEKL